MISSKPKTLRKQNYLTGVLSLLQVLVSFTGLCKRERSVYVRVDPTFINAAQDVAHPDGYLVGFVPHVTQVQTKDAAVIVQQGKWMKPGCLNNSLQ